jgi:lysophospholipase L1-like esterase
MTRHVPGLLVLALLLLACTSARPAARPGPAFSPRPAPLAPIVYAALGASDTVGVGAQDPARQAWPTVFYLTALPPTAVYYNLGIPGETTLAALSDELPLALAVRPTLVTVWLNVDDLAAGVSAADYEAQLGQLVRSAEPSSPACVEWPTDFRWSSRPPHPFGSIPP